LVLQQTLTRVLQTTLQALKQAWLIQNRSYKLRAQANLRIPDSCKNGWAFAASGVVRWSEKGMVDGYVLQFCGIFFSQPKKY
jgi:hypothetical protein